MHRRDQDGAILIALVCIALAQIAGEPSAADAIPHASRAAPALAPEAAR